MLPSLSIMQILLLGIIAILPAISGWGKREQSIAVEGILKCDGEALPNVKVKLYEVNVGRDTLMSLGSTDEEGHFELSGHVKQWSRITPKLSIYHKCKRSKRKCARKISYMIPKDYITDAVLPDQKYSIGEVDVAAKVSGEKTDCFH